MKVPKPDTADVLTARYGCHFRPQGRHRFTNCPFPGHRDSTPSFAVLPDGSWRCYGGCGAGDAVDAIRRMENLSLYEAVQIAEQFDSWVASRATPSRRQAEPPTQPLSDEQIAAIELAASYYAAQLESDGDAIDYLGRRGILLEVALERGVGVCRGTGLLRALAARGIRQESAFSAGLVSESGYERLRDRLTLPHRAGGRVTWLCGRLIDTADRKHRIAGTVSRRQRRIREIVRWLASTPGHDPRRAAAIDFILQQLGKIEWLLTPPKYLNVCGPKPLFWLPQEPTPVLFLIEGPIDAIVLSQWGYPAAAVCGSHLSISQLQQLQPFRYIPIFRDAGAKGLEFAQTWAEHLGPARAPIIDPAPGTEDAGDLGPLPNGRELAASVLSPFWIPGRKTEKIQPESPAETADTTAGQESTKSASAGWSTGTPVDRLPLIVCPHCGDIVFPRPLLSCCGNELRDGQQFRVLWVRGEVFATELYRFNKAHLSV